MKLNKKLIKKANKQTNTLPTLGALAVMSWRGLVWVAILIIGGVAAIFAFILSVITQPFRGI